MPDTLRARHSRKMREWPARHTEHIEVCFLPGDVPEINSDEYLDADLKARIGAADPVRDAAHLRRKVAFHLCSIPNQPARIRS
ncbi:MAG: hypothetical protein NNA21_07750 [Nitrospira sp.]|nr:hypothetical protein [Nitrospira sp.]MCP9461578.1 hypothetical protein [Nitrospira sp.]MCP9475791.1 hypothetical protein [Nitrospira sp.]